METVLLGMTLPFLGTALGAAGVFFCKGNIKTVTKQWLNGTAAGIMTAASVWSLILPALEQAAAWGRLRIVPVLLGFWTGILLFLAVDRLLNSWQSRAKTASPTAMTVLAVTLHNLPEGMAVGVVLAGYLAGGIEGAIPAVLSLSLGIAAQNIPEGAIVSLPVHAEGKGKGQAFLSGLLSGAVEPIGALLALLAASAILSALPFLLSFAAGAMVFVVLEELLPSLWRNNGSHAPTLYFVVGFSVMMLLDVTLG